MAQFTLQINGTSRQVEVDPNTPLLWVLRDHLQLVGTKFGCGMAQCGACTIHLDGTAARSCSLPVSSVALQPSLQSKGCPKMETIQCSKPGLNTMWLSADIVRPDKS